ncbi:MAG: RNase adapter RapZ [Abyssibacter sp.]|uniref:RNase adapter RapZ n=1 Tax=Abyssibacter sp. TaxID=2320200 RepID=UPI002EA2D143|nr:RNase adapter RapZ [Pseudomonadota bacterium]
MELIIVSGLSGAGKSVALRVLEDQGYFCIDNLPMALLDSLASHAEAKQAAPSRLAVGIDARASRDDIQGYSDHIAALRARGIRASTLFLEADDDVLLRRFSETRRKHPLTDNDATLRDAIETERRLLDPIADCADIILDTSQTNVHELRERVRHRIGGAPDAPLTVLFLSFGFKYGVPDDVDYVFDVRCLPNPHWKPALKPQTGQDADVADYLASLPACQALESDIASFLERWLPAFEGQDRTYITVGIGCTGGRHRSVYLVEALARRFRAAGRAIQIRHSELA